jgi:LysR family glycine cleavage system transcriptional activator
MNSDSSLPPLNSIRVFVAIARELSVTRAAATLGITQSAASRHLAALEIYLGAQVLLRRGRNVELSDFGKLFFDAVADAFDTINFTARRMRQSGERKNSLIVRTSLPTFAYSTLIPNLKQFSAEHGDISIDVVTSFAAPRGSDLFDVLITRDLEPSEAADHFEVLEEQLICVGAPSLLGAETLNDLLRRIPVLAVTSRPDILPRWTSALGISLRRIVTGARYDHHFLALPAAATGQGLLVAPEIVVADLLRQGVLAAAPGSRVKSGMRYHAYSVDRTGRFDLAPAFCRWVIRLCKAQSPGAT